MKSILFAGLMCSLSVTLLGQQANTLTAKEKADGWQLLFDGTTLKGWHASPSAPPPAVQTPGQIGTSPKACTGAETWEVSNGSAIPCGKLLSYMVSDTSFKNFVLSIDFRSAEDANSGVYFRSPKEAGGYEVQIWRQQVDGYNTGAIVATAKTAREFKFKAGEWNNYRIEAQGDHLVVALNGETTLDIHDAKFPEGNFRLQNNLFPIEFRNIKIRVLP